MQNNISGPGVGLQLPQNLYPSELYGAPIDVSTNYISLAAGDTYTLPAGLWMLTLESNLVVQYKDPVTGVWRAWLTGRDQCKQLRSDGFSVRIANLTGCAFAAVVENGGSGYVQSTTTVVATAGGSTWQPIVGGALSVSTVQNPGANYSIPPLVLIPAPPSPGVAATGYASLSSGTVSGVTLTNVGAGYPSAPTAVLVPAPSDLNNQSGTVAITAASITLALAGAGSITAVLCTNHGNPVTATPTLTVAGAGTGATIGAQLLQTLTAASVTGAGVGYGTAAAIVAYGGTSPYPEAIANPEIDATNFVPRPAQFGNATLVAGSITAAGSIIDGGLYLSAPAGIISGNGVVTTAASVALTLGGSPGTLGLQQL